MSQEKKLSTYDKHCRPITDTISIKEKIRPLCPRRKQLFH